MLDPASSAVELGAENKLGLDLSAHWKESWMPMEADLALQASSWAVALWVRGQSYATVGNRTSPKYTRLI